MCNCDNGFAGSVGRVLKAAVRGEQVAVDQTVLTNRLVLCADCDDLKRFQPSAEKGDDVGLRDMCGQCGCFARLKAGFATEACPLGKW